MLENQIFWLLLITDLPVYSTKFYLSHQSQLCHNFQYFEQHIKILWKKVQLFNFFMPSIDNNPDPDPAK